MCSTKFFFLQSVNTHTKKDALRYLFLHNSTKIFLSFFWYHFFSFFFEPHFPPFNGLSHEVHCCEEKQDRAEAIVGEGAFDRAATELGLVVRSRLETQCNGEGHHAHVSEESPKVRVERVRTNQHTVREDRQRVQKKENYERIAYFEPLAGALVIALHERREDRPCIVGGCLRGHCSSFIPVGKVRVMVAVL